MKSTIRFTAAFALVFAVQGRAQNVSQLHIEAAMISNAAVAFRFPVSGHFNIEPQRQAAIEQRLKLGVQGWALIDSASGNIITVTSFSNGQVSVEQAPWQQHFERDVASQLRYFPGAQDTSSTNTWGDTAKYRVSFRDDHGVYHTTECHGTAIDRLRSAVVCLNATTKVKGALDAALSGLTITIPYDAINAYAADPEHPPVEFAPKPKPGKPGCAPPCGVK